jgi:hypothetical protein
MSDWGQVLEFAYAAAPMAAAALLAVWTLWVVRRLLRLVARLCRTGATPPPARTTTARTGLRIEPVLGHAAFPEASSEDAEIRRLKERVDILIGRIDVLEGRLAALVPPPGAGRTLRVIRSDEVSPA